MKLIIDPEEWTKIEEKCTNQVNYYKNDKGTILAVYCDEFNCIYSYYDETYLGLSYYLGSTDPCQIDTGIDGGSSFIIEFYGAGGET